MAEGIRANARGLKLGTDMALAEVTDDTFDAEVMRSAGPVIVDFWAEWCTSCKQMMPHLESLSDELGGAVKIVKLNIEDSPMTAGKLGIRGVPTMMIFQDGKLKATKLGAMNKSKIAEWLQESAAA
jgi:thioredoxin 1